MKLAESERGPKSSRTQATTRLQCPRDLDGWADVRMEPPSRRRKPEGIHRESRGKPDRMEGLCAAECDCNAVQEFAQHVIDLVFLMWCGSARGRGDMVR